MGESQQQRAGLIAQLANLDPYPESVPTNHLVRVKGTPLDPFYGDKLLTTGNPDTQADLDLLQRLGLKRGQPA